MATAAASAGAGAGAEEGAATTARISVTLSPAKKNSVRGGRDERGGGTRARRTQARTAATRAARGTHARWPARNGDPPLSKMRPSARRGPAGAAPLATGTSSASSSTRFINSSKPIMRPSIRKLDCSYSHTAMRVRWQEKKYTHDAGQGRGGWRRKRAGGEKQEDKGRRRHAIDMLRTVCKKRKMTVSGCVIALETRGAPDISEGSG
jgi:hypothetical protein